MPDGWRVHVGWLFALVLAGFAWAGCAQDVGDIDRTQPDKIKKSLLKDSGEWYFRQTVVDTTVEGDSGTSLGAGGRFERTQSPIFTGLFSRRLKRIKWEIHEDVLYARSTVEPVEGLTEQVDGERNRELGIVAAFPIKSHFDVQRQYNPRTGEPSNVIVENRSDRHWYDREYMRVDWSTNLVTAFSSVFQGLGRLSPKQTSVSRRSIPQTESRATPFRTRVTDDYIDAVSEYVFNPDIYACMTQLGSDSIWKCEGGTATVRNAFMKVPEEQDYKPLQYRDDLPLTKEGSTEPMQVASTRRGSSLISAECTQPVVDHTKETLAQEKEEACDDASFSYFERFGFFRISQATWDRDRHTYDSGRKQYAQRWDIWDTMYKENGDVMKMENREPEPIVFHLNAGYPKHMMPAAQKVEAHFDRAFKKTVKEAKNLDSIQAVEDELTDAPGDRAEPTYDHGKMFVIKKNSCHPSKIVEWFEKRGSAGADRADVYGIFNEYAGVEPTADEATQELWSMSVAERKRLCAELSWATEPRPDTSQFDWERMGDLRYSFFAWVTDFNIGWLGYGPSSSDPKTGEIISASAHFAGRLLGTYASYGADIVKYLNGELSREDIRRGTHVRREIAQQQEQGGDETSSQGLTPPSSGVEGPTGGADVSEAEIERRRVDLEEVRDFRRSDSKPATPAELGMTIDEMNEKAFQSMETSIQKDAQDDRMLDWLQRSETKERLMSQPMVEKAVKAKVVDSHGQSGLDNEDAMHQAYMSFVAPMIQEAQMERRQEMFRKNSIMTSEAAEQMVEGLALFNGIAERFKGEDRETIENYFRNSMFFGTQVHEVGHTVGLRHHYSASLDALNYPKAFWRLEKMKQLGCSQEQQESIPECSDGELSQEEARRGSQELASAVLGETPGFIEDAGYVSQSHFRTASVMDYLPMGGTFSGLGPYDQAALNFAYGRQVQQWKKPQNVEGIDPDKVEIGPNFSLNLRRTNYTEIPRILGDKDILFPRSACKSSGSLNEDCVERGFKYLMNGRKWISIEEAKRERKKTIRDNAEVIAGSQSDSKVDRLVDYRFCTDDREGQYIGCQAFDWGSNHVEALGYEFEKFRALQPFNRYRGYEIAGNPSVMFGDYQRDLLGALQIADVPFRYFSFYKQLDYDVGAFTDDLEKAARRGLNFYGELLTRPEPTTYCEWEEGELPAEYRFTGKAKDLDGAYVPRSTYRRAQALNNCERSEQIDIPTGPGQFFGYDTSSEYNFRINRIGTFIDKSLAARRMFQLDSTFTFQQFITDIRAVNISYWTEFPDQLYTLIHGLFLGDYSNFGGGLDTQTGEYHTWDVVSPKLADNQDGNGSANPLPSNLRKVYDPQSFNIRSAMIIAAIAEFSTWEDLRTDFDEYVQIAASESELQNLPDDFPEEDKGVFVHPDTNRKYVALRAPDGKSITYDLVQWANDLKTRMVDARENGETDAASQLKEDLENVVAKMNLIRQARSIYSHEG